MHWQLHLLDYQQSGGGSGERGDLPREQISYCRAAPPGEDAEAEEKRLWLRGADRQLEIKKSDGGSMVRGMSHATWEPRRSLVAYTEMLPLQNATG